MVVHILILKCSMAGTNWFGLFATVDDHIYLMLLNKETDRWAVQSLHKT